MQEPEYRNVIFDIHRYQCFERGDIDMDIYGHMNKAAGIWKAEADGIITELGLPTICGEWSLGLDLKVVSLWADGPFNHALEHMDAFQENVAYRATPPPSWRPSRSTRAGSSGTTRPRPPRPGASATASNAAGCLILCVARTARWRRRESAVRPGG